MAQLNSNNIYLVYRSTPLASFLHYGLGYTVCMVQYMMNGVKEPNVIAQCFAGYHASSVFISALDRSNYNDLAPLRP